MFKALLSCEHSSKLCWAFKALLSQLEKKNKETSHTTQCASRFWNQLLSMDIQSSGECWQCSVAGWIVPKLAAHMWGQSSSSVSRVKDPPVSRTDVCKIPWHVWSSLTLFLSNFTWRHLYVSLWILLFISQHRSRTRVSIKCDQVSDSLKPFKRLLANNVTVHFVIRRFP